MDAESLSELRQQLRRFIAAKAPREKRRIWDRDHTWPRDLFRELASMGLCGLTIEERYEIGRASCRERVSSPV